MIIYLNRAAKLLSLLCVCLYFVPWTLDPVFAADKSDGKTHVMSDNTIVSLRSKEETAFHYGVSAYIWGYSLVVTERLQRFRATQTSSGVPRAALNQFGHVRDLRDADYKAIPTPNNDTLYSQAFLDLRKEPIVVRAPDVDGRYYVLPFLSAYQDVFASVGTRETGTGAGDYAIVGPDWRGDLPGNVTRIDAPTNTVIIWGRTVVYGKEDLDKARAVQDALALIPLSQFGDARRTPEPDWEASRTRVARTAWNAKGGVPKSLSFFDELGKAMMLTPPRPADRAAVEQFSNIGLTPEHGFDLESLDEATIMGLSRAVTAAELMIDGAANTRGVLANGWFFNTEAGVFGNDYLFRAAVAKWYMGANVPEEAMYYVGKTNSKGEPHGGKNRYRLHFEDPPPAKAFWSLSIYNSSDGSFVDNELNRYSIGDRTEGLRKNTDGSLDVYIQSTKPEKDTAANWLPAPQEQFYLVLRLYMPDERVVSGEWLPPELKTLEE